MRGPLPTASRLGFLVAAVALAWGRPSAAGPSAEDIKAAAAEFDQGKQSFKARAWAEAAEHFEAADARAPSAVALELAIRARDKAGQLDRAATLAELGLARHAGDAALKKTAAPILERARKELHALRVGCRPACELVVGTTIVHGGATDQRTAYLAPGDAQISASWPGRRPQVTTVKASAGGKSEADFVPPADAPEPTVASKPPPPAVTVVPARDPAADDRSGLPPIVFYVGAGLTVIAGGVTIWSGLDTQNNPGADTVREQCAGQGTSCPAYQDGLDRQNRTNILLGVTAGLAVTSGVIGVLFTDWSGKPKGSARVEPWLGFGAAGARGRF